jgi:beta-lactam-binding protein with PASTA domain
MRLLSALLIIALTGYLIVTTVMRYFSVSEVSLPDVTGMTTEDAIGTLANLGFNTKTYSKSVSGALLNSVAAQNPEAGAVVRQGRSISLGVNFSGDVGVPLLIGSTQEQAKTILDALGLELGEVSYTFSDVAEGQVLAQVPEQASQVAPFTKVSVVVSRGPTIPTVTMPEVRGLGIDAAKQRLRSLGFSNIDTIPSSVSSDRPQSVTQQSPGAKEMVTASTRVTLGYSLSSSVVVQVPSLMGSTLQNAQATLQSAGLTLGLVSYTNDPAKPSGISTYAPSRYTVHGAPILVEFNGYEPIPAPGPAPAISPTQPVVDPVTPTPVPEVQPQLAPVENTVQTLPATTSSDGSRELPFAFDPKDQGISALLEKPYNLRLEVVDDRGKRELLNRKLLAGEPVKASFPVYGQAQLQAFINDILYQAWSY